MPTNRHEHLRMVGRQLLAARTRSGQSRADLAHAAGISEKSLARLESGREVRLSTYLAVAQYLASQRHGVVGLAERVALLPELVWTRVLELVERFERSEKK